MSAHRLPIRLLVLALAAPASANTYLVDDDGGPGVQFTDIAPAIAAAQPGDVLLVAPGTYSPFTLDKGLVIVGYGATNVAGLVQVRNVPAGPRAAVVHFTTPRFVVDHCTAPVVLQQLSAVSTAFVGASPDVRISGTSIGGPSPVDGQDALTIQGSRVEFVDGWIVGHTGVPHGVPGLAWGPGGDGVVLSAGRFVGVRFQSLGGAGSDESSFGVQAGDGGSGLIATTGASAVFLGASSRVWSGDRGINWSTQSCAYDGCQVFSVDGDLTPVVTSSGTDLRPSFCQANDMCTPWDGPATYGVTLVTPTPAEPTLAVTTNPVAGGTLTFVVHGEPGASVELTIGRGFTVTPTAGVTTETLVPGGRVLPLGAIPSNGLRAVSFVLPASVPPGYVMDAQASVTGTNGLARTNSTPIVVR